MSYEEFVESTDISDGDPQFYLDGMNEENGEITGVLKRVRRGDYGEEVKTEIKKFGIQFILDNYPKICQDLIKEIGDRHWYTTRFLQKIGTSWKEVEKVNLEKLTKRVDKGLIMGHGDDREE